MAQKTGVKGAERKAPPEPSDDEVRTAERPESVREPGDERHRARDEELDRRA
jgi:hypothetical protein